MANHLPFDMLNSLIENRTSPLEEPPARRHLAACGRCRSELEWLQRIRELPAEPVRSQVGWKQSSDADRLD
ncbi:MAG: hypothetical protein M3069_33700 [Chloroflexota bacterium]|nr:hypothetical protein [Chloroflexota bacterium]